MIKTLQLIRGNNVNQLYPLDIKVWLSKNPDILNISADKNHGNVITAGKNSAENNMRTPQD